jgi:hemerythrin
MPDDHEPAAGSVTMDNEHRVQIGLILALEQGLTQGKSLDELKAIVDQLVAYTDMHFMSEQLLMRLYAYPEIGEHTASHDKLIEQAGKIATDFHASKDSNMSADLLLLKQWLLDHIRTEDAAFHRHLTESA